MATFTFEKLPSYETSEQQQVGYPPATQHITIINSQPTVALFPAPLMYGLSPTNMVCPHCQSQIFTSTSYEPGNMTWLLCGGIAMVGGWLGCCFIPFCMDDTKDCRHTCPNCKNFLGVYRRC